MIGYILLFICVVFCIGTIVFSCCAGIDRIICDAQGDEADSIMLQIASDGRVSAVDIGKELAADGDLCEKEDGENQQD